MDPLTRTYYWARFEIAFLRQKGVAFQDWFCQLAKLAFETDFERVRPNGAEGDFKADGRTLSDGTIYQSYGPERMEQSVVIRKINDDLAGAVDKWGGWIERWVLVHNDGRGLPPKAVQRLDQLREEHPSIRIETWSRDELERIARRLSQDEWESMFGVAPSASGMEAVVADDVAEVSRHLEKVEPPPDAPIRAPSVNKIAKNGLSEQMVTLLNAGKRKDGVVKRYFETHHRPDFGERIAEAFRNRYRSLREDEEAPDAILLSLWQFIGEGASTRHSSAELAILAYLFDRCDIFEDPESPS